jgi:hypothetical protein
MDADKETTNHTDDTDGKGGHRKTTNEKESLRNLGASLENPIRHSRKLLIFTDKTLIVSIIVFSISGYKRP